MKKKTFLAKAGKSHFPNNSHKLFVLHEIISLRTEEEQKRDHFE